MCSYTIDIYKIIERRDLGALPDLYRYGYGYEVKALVVISDAGWVEGVRYALERVSDPNATVAAYSNATALHVAAASGRVAAINLLLERGRCSRSLAIKDTEDGSTPLIVACGNLEWDAAKAIVEHPHGPSLDVLNLRDDDGQSAFWVVFDPEDDPDPAKRLAVADAMRARGVDMGVKDKDGCTALHNAVKAMNTASISYLLKHAPHLATIPDNAGNLPIDFTARYGEHTIVPMFEEAAARASAAGPTPQQPVLDPLQWTFKQIEDACQRFAPAAVLGRGTFSTVYAGTASTGRDVAIKTIDAAVYRTAMLGDKGAWATTFKNEIKLLRRLKHPNLVELVGWGVDGSGSRMAAVLELVEETLGARLFKTVGKTPLPPVGRLRIALGVARGLTYLHGQTEEVLTQGLQPVYHRDIKSQNIGLTADLTPKLLDYGLARTAAAANELMPGTIAVTGRIVGSVGYMPPEVTKGKYNARSEIYSFGMVLLELCTLRPCTAETPDAVEEATDDGANAGGLRTLMADAAEAWPGGSLDLFLALINSCVQRRPARRPPSMRHVLVSLDAILRAAVQRDPAPRIQPPTVTADMVDQLAAQLDAARIEAAAAEEEETKDGEHGGGLASPRAPNELLLTCSTCYDDMPATGGIACKAPAGIARHFLCHPCLEHMVRAELGDRGQLVVRSHCAIRCPSWNVGCTAAPWGPADLAGKLSPEANLFYLERVHEMYLHLERREQARQEAAAKQALERARDEVGCHHNRIADLLVLKCPNCDRGFTDVDGCNAVSCSGTGDDGREYGCGAVFCFVCFQVGNSTEVHSHMTAADHWIKGEALEGFRRQRRIDAISQYLRGLPEPLRRRVLEVASARTLGDVGIRAADLRL